jgi:hypothetical protein
MGVYLDGAFNWDSFVASFVHPVKVAIIEAMVYMEVTLSPRELDRMFDEQFGVSLISYHMRTLAEAGAVERVRQRPVRGSVETFYALSPCESKNPSHSCP